MDKHVCGHEATYWDAVLTEVCLDCYIKMGSPRVRIDGSLETEEVSR